MKGLLIKDLMCLRKQCLLFVFLVFAVFIVSIMFVLSVRFGNMARLAQTESGLEDELEMVSTFVLMLFMLLPISMTGDITSVFVADGKANFSRVSSSLPISIEKRLLSRYLMLGAMFGIGIGVDIVIAFILSLLTEIISFADFFGIIISAASIMLIYSALAILFCLMLDYGKEAYAQSCAISTMMLGFYIFSYKDINHLFTSIFLESGEEAVESSFFHFLDFLKYKSYVVFIIAIVTVFLSYGLSLAVAKRKRGII